MASQFSYNCLRASTRAALSEPRIPKLQNPHFILIKEPPDLIKLTKKNKPRILRSTRIHVSSGGDSYLDMWKKAVDRDRKSKEFERIAENMARDSDDDVGEAEEEEKVSQEQLERKSSEFQKILDVSTEERDRIQRMQVVDRAAAAIAAARALLKENKPPKMQESSEVKVEAGEDVEDDHRGEQNGNSLLSLTGGTSTGTPGPNFWSWMPPSETDDAIDGIKAKLDMKAFLDPTNISPVMEKEQSADFLFLPFESKSFPSKAPLPPLQSLVEVEELGVSSSAEETPHLEEEHELGIAFSANAAEAVQALYEAKEVSSQGFYPDGSRWWKDTGLERRPDGVVCKWTLTRGVSSDKVVEWEEKYWEAADEFGYKELGSEKSGRDATGNVWHEYWRESMSQNGGLVQLEKTADKWGKNGKGDEWQEQWWEHYGASGKAEKWAHKWCSIDPNTPLEAGHAHVWHERWGETYDGQGGSAKYTDKWAECFQGDGWDKWGDKWDENFDLNGNGVKQGETWWQGKHGDRWNRTWGEHHNNSGWVHKYGKSSSGEHWDTHVQQDTWYERFPHYGFYHCFENSVQLREVKKPSEWS
ncbi:protein LIKE EARLY STARVATION, chloroplastic [Coffea arabica]|uniref:Protein LIKE EARLY STARVATION, chloroplastic n=1 Tax=Coffea arabica TaxID=13443 RepID=A0A6P6WMA2_COFAR|nr:uncharacterized protein LOC113734190 [Coffea arabica]